MATEREYQGLYDRIAALRETGSRPAVADLVANPQLADALTKQIDDLLSRAWRTPTPRPPRRPTRAWPSSSGVGPEPPPSSAKTRIPQGVEPYDETVTSERIVAVGDLYYIYQHEQIGVFRVVQKLQELFRGRRGAPVRRRRAPIALYQFDRREVLRYTHARPPRRLPPGARLRQRAGAGRRRGRTPTSTSCSATSSTR